MQVGIKEGTFYRQEKGKQKYSDENIHFAFEQINGQ
jgi:hypothetical protein